MAGQIWLTNADGGYMYADKLSRELRMAVQPTSKFRHFCDAKDATKARNPEGNMLGKGDTFHWNVYSDVQNQGTTLVETSTMPESKFTIAQGTLTVNEYGNSVPYSGKLDDLSEHPIREIIHKVLKNDAKKSFDTDSHAQFNTTLLRVVPTSGTSTTAISLTTNGTATATNGIAMGKAHVKLIVDLMKERDIPPYIDDDYVSLGHPSTFRGLKDDLEDIHQYTEQGFRKIHRGEIGRYENTRFVEQTNIAKETFVSATSNWSFFFGEDTVAEGIVIPEEMRGKIPTDYGRSKGIAWYALLGYGQTQTQVGQTRIVKWDSAA